ncbi:MAG TPA: lamin tail domain-containing protein, partial [Verrucomicrobiae bacterium]|nr:lamin tail domain-containing protein [Verrucomicrobiae bacterium]
MSRSLLSLFLAALSSGAPALADSTVVFNEIMYHPATSESSLEWVELHNQMAVNMDLSGWSIEGGIDFAFPEGTVLTGGGYLVVAISPAALAAAGYTNAFGPFAGRLSNSGEILEVRNNNHRLMDSIDYDTDDEWPVGPDGAGVSLAKLNPNSASEPATNWTMSAQVGGTPGAPNFPGTAQTPTNVALVNADRSWRYQNSGGEPGAGWRTAGFDDSAWFSGRALFHAGSPQVPAGEPQPVPTLFNTGLDANHDTLAPGAPDPHYALTVSAHSTPPPPPIAATVIQNHPAWSGNDPLSSWIGPVNPGTANIAAGEYRYRTAFDLTGFDAATAEVILSVAADNRVNDVLLNGASRGISFVGFSGFSPDFTVQGGFVAGANTLEFITANDSTTPNPGGFRARLNGTARKSLPLNTPLASGHVTDYFRAAFLFAGDPAATALKLNALADDGAVFYLNDVEILRVNLPGGQITSSTFASTNVTNSAWTGLLPISSASLRAGTNVLAVELHQAPGGTNDLLFTAELVATPAPPARPTLAFNEIAASTNAVFWLELANNGTNDIPLDGYVVVNDGAVDRQFIFLSGPSLAAGGRLALNESQLGFRPQSGDRLYLHPPNRNSVVDAVVVQPSLRGRSPDGTGRWLYPVQPTPGGANLFAFRDEIVINEIMYHPRALPSAPAAFQEATLLPITAVWKYHQSGID